MDLTTRGKILQSVLVLSFVCSVCRPTAALVLPDSGQPCTEQQFNDKELDVVIFGATGFSGKLSAEYLATHPDKPKWGIAGRNRDKIYALLDKLDTANKPSQWESPVDLHDMHALSSLVNKTRVIVTFVGPYEQLGGDNLIRAALKGCTHYVDISTELHWNAKVVDSFDSVAKARGLAIVQSAGFNSLMPDLLVSSAAADLPHAPMSDAPSVPSDVLVVWTKLNGGAGGGLIAASQHEWQEYGAIYDPYILTPHLPEWMRTDQAVNALRANDHRLFGKKGHVVLQDYTGAKLDSPLIRRSMAIQFPGKAISVREALTTSVVDELTKFTEDPRMYLQPPEIRPSPGSGPPRWMLKTGSFAGTGIAVGKTGDIARIHVHGTGDPSFFGTARMATELALGLAGKKPFETSGCLTPASAIGSKELEWRLARADNGKFLTFEHTMSHTDASGYSSLESPPAEQISKPEARGRKEKSYPNKFGDLFKSPKDDVPEEKTTETKSGEVPKHMPVELHFPELPWQTRN